MSGIVKVRPETPPDFPVVRAIHDTAFGGTLEGDIVEALRAADCEQVSLVGELDGSVVAHILFSPVAAENYPAARLMGLGPMAVLPAAQRCGVGSALVGEGLKHCGKLGCDGVVVLGHVDYYPRFGFTSASGYGLRCEYEVPDEAFMALALSPGSLDGISGLVRYHSAFGAS